MVHNINNVLDNHPKLLGIKLRNPLYYEHQSDDTHSGRYPEHPNQPNHIPFFSYSACIEYVR